MPCILHVEVKKTRQILLPCGLFLNALHSPLLKFLTWSQDTPRESLAQAGASSSIGLVTPVPSVPSQDFDFNHDSRAKETSKWKAEAMPDVIVTIVSPKHGSNLAGEVTIHATPRPFPGKIERA